MGARIRDSGRAIDISSELHCNVVMVKSDRTDGSFGESVTEGRVAESHPDEVPLCMKATAEWILNLGAEQGEEDTHCFLDMYIHLDLILR